MVQFASEENSVIEKNKFHMLIVATAVLTALPVGVSLAQETRAGRYTMHKTDDGLMRLDTETGAVAMCRNSETGWGCRTIAGTMPADPDGVSAMPLAPGGDMSGRAPMMREIDRLTRENEDLKAEIKRLDELLGLRGERNREFGSSKEFKLPTEAEVDQALNYFDRMLKKFQDRLKQFEKQPTEKPAEKLPEKLPERQL